MRLLNSSTKRGRHVCTRPRALLANFGVAVSIEWRCDLGSSGECERVARKLADRLAGGIWDRLLIDAARNVLFVLINGLPPSAGFTAKD